MPKAIDLVDVSFKYIGVSYNVLDCKAFVEQCLSDIGIHKNLPGSNAWYREMTWVGTPEECVKAFGYIPPGAFLFILEDVGPNTPEKYKHDGLGDASHIGIYTAQGKGAIASSCSRAQVCESEFHGKTIKNGGWNRVGLWDALEYDGIHFGDQEDPIMAVVRAGTGSTVNLRSKPSKSGVLVTRVPVGSQVDVLDYGELWSRVTWDGYTGYMMSQFLDTEGETSGDMIQVSKAELQEIYDRIGGLLGQ